MTTKSTWIKDFDVRSEIIKCITKSIGNKLPWHQPKGLNYNVKGNKIHKNRKDHTKLKISKEI